MTRKEGYFAVPIEAARCLLPESDGPELLGGFVAVCSSAYPSSREFTLAGRNLLAKATGMTSYRGGQVLDLLRSLRYGEKGELFVIEPTGEKGRTKGGWVTDQYRFGQWPGRPAYIPSLLIGTALQRFFDGALGDPELRRDALFVLLHVYAHIDYAGFIGAPIDRMPYQVWDIEGTRHSREFDLGKAEAVGGTEVWLISPPENDMWTCQSEAAGNLIGHGEEATRRMWAALRFLLDNHLLSKVAVVEHDSGRYPLWFFGQAARDSYHARFHIETDLAAKVANMACRTGIDPDNLVMRKAIEEGGGTSLYYCLRVGTRRPLKVYTIICPVLYAPTPNNLSDLGHVSQTCVEIVARIGSLEKALKDVA